MKRKNLLKKEKAKSMSDCVERPDAASLGDKKSRPVSSEAAIWISCSLLIAGFVVTHPAMWLYRPNLEGFSKVFTRLPTAIIAIISIAFAPVFSSGYTRDAP